MRSNLDINVLIKYQTPMVEDKIFDQPRASSKPFCFDEEVAAVFADMIERSVPGYQLVLETMGQVVISAYQKGTVVYDLGCSLGEGALALAHAISPPAGSIVGVDSSEAMLSRAREHLDRLNEGRKVALALGDVRTYLLKPTSFIALNFVLQFVPPADRQAVIDQIYRALVPGGILFMSEKIRSSSEKGNRYLIDLYHAFKRRNGYSELAIAQKRAALEEVLIPDTLQTHQHRLEQAGFSSSQVWFQNYNFISLIAWK